MSNIETEGQNFRIRMIEMGRVIKEGTAHGADYMEVFDEAHPELMDPIIQCEREVPVVWVEIRP